MENGWRRCSFPSAWCWWGAFEVLCSVLVSPEWERCGHTGVCSVKMTKVLEHLSCGKRLRSGLVHPRKGRALVGVISMLINPGEVRSKNNRTRLFLMRVLGAVGASSKHIKLHSYIRKLFIFFFQGWSKVTIGSPESWWSVQPWTYSELTRYDPGSPTVIAPFEEAVWTRSSQRALPTSSSPWNVCTVDRRSGTRQTLYRRRNKSQFLLSI